VTKKYFYLILILLISCTVSDNTTSQDTTTTTSQDTTTTTSQDTTTTTSQDTTTTTSQDTTTTTSKDTTTTTIQKIKKSIKDYDYSHLKIQNSTQEHLVSLGFDRPQEGVEPEIVYATDTPEYLVREYIEIQKILYESLGPYNRYIHFIVSDVDSSKNVLNKLTEVKYVWNKQEHPELPPINCLAGSSGYWENPPDPYDLCIITLTHALNPHGMRDWASETKIKTALYSGYAHEYFHAYQRRWFYGERLIDIIPMWFIEGSSTLHQNIWLRDNWTSFSAFQGLSFAEVEYEGMDLNNWYKRNKEKFRPGGDCINYSLKIEVDYGADKGTCRGYIKSFGPAYMAYLTSYQTVYVDIYRDFYELGWEKSFEKHIGMTIDEFYDSWYEFMISDEYLESPPPGFFPEDKLSSYVDFISK